MRRRVPCLLLALLASASASPARSAVPWPDGHVASIYDYSMGSYGETGLQFMPSAPGSFWTHSGARLDPSWHIVSRISSSGEFLVAAKRVDFFSNPATGGFAADALGSLFFLRIPYPGPALELGGWDASGAALPSVAVAAGKTGFIHGQLSGAAADGGGAWFLWPQSSGGGAPAGPRLLRVTASGGIASGWPASGGRHASRGAREF